MKRRTFLKLSTITASYLSNSSLLFGNDKKINLYDEEFKLIYGDIDNHGKFVSKSTSWDIWSNRGVIFREKQIYTDSLESNYPDTNPSGDNREASYSQLIYLKDRILYPMKKEKESWRRIDWEEAVNEIADKLGSSTKPLIYGGGGLIRKRFRFESIERLRVTCNGVAIKQNIRDYEIKRCNYKGLFDCDLVMFWGANPIITDVSNAHYIIESRYKGAKIISVCSDFNNTAKISDYWVDSSSIDDTNLIKEMILEVLSEKTDIEKIRVLESFQEIESVELLQETLKADLKSTKEEKEAAKYLIEEILNKKRKSLVLGHRFGKDFVELIKLLSLICDIDYSFSECNCFDIPKQETKEDGYFDSVEVFEEVSPKVAVIAGDNLFRKNSKSFREKFIKNIEFFVYMDIRVNEMATFADIILPIKSDYEIEDIQRGIYPPSNLEAVGESKSEEEIVSMILEKIQEKKSQESVYEESVYEKSTDTNWNFTSIYASSQPNQDINKDFSYKLYMSRSKWSYNSTFRASRFLLRLQRGEPFVMICKEDAKELNLKDSEKIRLYNKDGEINIKVKISNTPAKGSLIIEYGWESYMFENLNAPNVLFGESKNSTRVDIKKVSL